MLDEARHPIQLVLTTCPDKNSADVLATSLVESGLAACVNIIPGLESVFTWQGEAARETEWLLLIKAPRDKFAQISAHIDQLHPYELPECVAVPIDAASAAFAAWVVQCCSGKKP